MAGGGQCMDKYNLVDMCSPQFIIKSIILFSITIAILLGNSLVITSVFLYRKLKKSVSNSFIASLALADLVLAILVLPFSSTYEILGYWIFQPAMCRIWLVVDVWVCTASILHLCMISVDRYIAIAFPLRYPRLMTHRRCRLICVCLWILSFIVGIPGAVTWSDKQTDGMHLNASVAADPLTNETVGLETVGQPMVCKVEDYSVGYTIYSAVGSFFIPSIVMSGFYIKIFLLARKYLRQAQTGALLTTENGASAMRVHRGGVGANGSPEVKATASTNEESRADEDIQSNKSDPEQLSRDSSIVSKTLIRQVAPSLLRNVGASRVTARNAVMNRETRAAKTVAIVVGCFIACWTPFFICYLIQGIRGEELNEHLFHFFIWVGYINSLINPCIYACFSNDYRHAFKKILRCQVRRISSRSGGVAGYFNSLYVSSTSNRMTRETVSKVTQLKPLQASSSSLDSSDGGKIDAREVN